MGGSGNPGIGERIKKLAMDGWSNLLTGLNNSATSKKRQTRHRPDELLSDEELESMYVEDGLAARIVNLMPNDMFREGWEYTFMDMEELKVKELAEQYKDVMEAIEASQKCKEALQWARLKGGAALLIGVIDGMTPDEPLNPARIKSFEKLRILDLTDIEYDKILFQLDPLLPRFGMPEFYPVKYAFEINAQQNTVMVHHSRIIEFHGDRLPTRAKRALSAERRYWGISVLQRADEHLKIIGSSIGSIDQLLHEMSVGKFKIKDLSMILATQEGKEAIQRRVEVMDLTRSGFRSQFFDSDGEDYSRDTVNFSSIPEILNIIFMLIAADTSYPITRLFGISPGGMNSTGESDMRNYYDAVRSEQGNVLLPVILRLVRIISQWLKIEEPYIEFVPLETMNEKEQAEVEKLKADTSAVKANTYKTLIDAGVIEPYEARFLEFGTALDNIPVPEENTLPHVNTVGDEPPPVDDTPDTETEPQNPDAKPKPTGANASA
jgi:phage-related protein (TIGR01555 family)